MRSTSTTSAFNGDASDRLSKACSNGDAHEAARALADGADPNHDCKGKHWSKPSELPLPLHMAFRRNDPTIASLLIQAGADINARSDNGAPMPLWLSMGSACAPLWIAAGGEPWRVWSYFGGNTHICYAHVAARGGSKDIWNLLAAKLPDADLVEKLAIEDGKATSIARAIIRWENIAAVEALGKAGWRPTKAISTEAAKDAASHLAIDNKALAARTAKLCQALARAGSEPPDWEEVSADMIWMTGIDPIERARALVEPSFARGQAMTLRTATPRARTSKKKSANRL